MKRTITLSPNHKITSRDSGHRHGFYRRAFIPTFIVGNYFAQAREARKEFVPGYKKELLTFHF